MKKEEDILKIIKALRIKKGLTQKEVAAKLNVVPSAYSKLERGERAIRFEHLEKLEKVFETSIEKLLLDERKIYSDSSESNEAMKNRIELLEKMICLFSIDFQENIEHLLDEYEKCLPDYPIPFEDYLGGDIPGVNPEFAFNMIKDNVEAYKRFLKKYNYQITDENFLEIFHKESEEENYDCYNREDYEYFKDYNDEQLMEFVRKEDNYSFVHGIMMSPGFTKEEDLYNAFKKMLGDQPIIELAFSTGLLENHSWYKVKWQKYLNEMKEKQHVEYVPDDPIQYLRYIENKERYAKESEVRVKIKEKLQDILLRNNAERLHGDWDILMNFKPIVDMK